jgi:hypothetical protein
MKEESPGLKPESRENNIQMKMDVGENESDIEDEEEDSDEEENNDDSVLQAYQMRRTWESRYICFVYKVQSMLSSSKILVSLVSIGNQN